MPSLQAGRASAVGVSSQPLSPASGERGRGEGVQAVQLTTAAPGLVPQLLADINATASFSSPGDLTAVGSTLFFAATESLHGTELWRSNGTPAGTQLVADINPGPGNSNPTYLTNVNGTLFFQANDGVHGATLGEQRYRGRDADGPGHQRQRWQQLAALRPHQRQRHALLLRQRRPAWPRDMGQQRHRPRHRDGRRHQPHGASPGDITNVNGTVFFVDSDGVHGIELWRTNGAAFGTSMVADINPGSRQLLPEFLDQRGRHSLLRRQ